MAAIVTTTVLADYTDSKYHASGTMAITASPATYASGGIACSLYPVSSLTGTNYQTLKATIVPDFIRVVGIAGYIYEYVNGTDSSNGLLRIFVQDATNTNPLAQLGNGTAIPAGVSGDVISWFGQWKGTF